MVRPTHTVLGEVLVVADDGLVDVHLTLVDVVPGGLRVVTAGHFLELSNQSSHHCLHILILGVRLVTLKIDNYRNIISFYNF